MEIDRKATIHSLGSTYHKKEELASSVPLLHGDAASNQDQVWK